MYKTIADAFEDLGKAQEFLLDEGRGEVTAPPSEVDEAWKNVQAFLGTVLSSRPSSPLFSFSPQDVVLAKKVYQGDLEMCRKEVSVVKSLVDRRVQQKKLLAPEEAKPVDVFLGKVVDSFLGEKDLSRYRRYTA